MIIKTKAHSVCLVCKKKIKKDETIALLKTGIVIHTKGCIGKLKKYAESIQKKQDIQDT